jgi:hypothetical protein
MKAYVQIPIASRMAILDATEGPALEVKNALLKPHVSGNNKNFVDSFFPSAKPSKKTADNSCSISKNEM